MMTKLRTWWHERWLPLLSAIYKHPLLYPVLHPFFRISSTLLSNYKKHQVFQQSAALAYFTLFSLPALIIVVIGLTGYFLGKSAVEGKIFDALRSKLGDEVALQVQDAVLALGSEAGNWWATVFGLFLLLFIATGAFNAMQNSLNTIFEVEAAPVKVRFIELLINRLLSLGMIFSMGIILLLSIISNTLLNGLMRFKQQNEAFVSSIVPPSIYPYLDYMTENVLILLNIGISLVLIGLFVATIYRILPAVKLKWKEIFFGSAFVAILFWLGELLISWYLNRTSIATAYGAAGSLIVLLIWISYSAQLVFLGAEFIVAIKDYKGMEMQPKKFSRLLQRFRKKKED